MIHAWNLNRYTLGKTGLWRNGNVGVLHIRQSPRTGASPSDAVKYHSVEMQTKYYTVQVSGIDSKEIKLTRMARIVALKEISQIVICWNYNYLWGIWKRSQKAKFSGWALS